MNYSVPLYEGDGYLHRRPAQASVPVPQDAAEADLEAIRRDAQALRRKAIRNAAGALLRWIGRLLDAPKRRRIESYLAQSTDHADLERRLRDIERGTGLRFS